MYHDLVKQLSVPRLKGPSDVDDLFVVISCVSSSAKAEDFVSSVVFRQDQDDAKNVRAPQCRKTFEIICGSTYIRDDYEKTKEKES